MTQRNMYTGGPEFGSTDPPCKSATEELAGRTEAESRSLKEQLSGRGIRVRGSEDPESVGRRVGHPDGLGWVGLWLASKNGPSSMMFVVRVFVM